MKYATSATNQQLTRPHGMIARTLNVQSIHTLHVKRNREKKRKQIAPIVNIAERRKQMENLLRVESVGELATSIVSKE